MMKLTTFALVLSIAIASVLGQTIELGSPQNGDVLTIGQNFTAQVILPESLASVIQIGIALAMDNCNSGVCPQPTEQLGDVLYAGTWTPTAHSQGGFYQNFTLQVSEYFPQGQAVFTLTHFGLIGGGPVPFTEFRNASVTVVATSLHHCLGSPAFTMKLFSLVVVLIVAVTSALGQLIELGYPTNGAVIHRGKNFTVQVQQPGSIASVWQVGIALTIDPCTNGVCPQPTEQLGDVLYAGPWTPTAHQQGGFYQNFTFQLDQYMPQGPAIFTLTHFCLLGGGPVPFTEFRNATVTVK
ncbi:hypothetical protein ID866_7786 [Astraeus odoratus]|nr:hypothetical protein ID866_7786 [Astraeus odoratus]